MRIGLRSLFFISVAIERYLIEACSQDVCIAVYTSDPVPYTKNIVFNSLLFEKLFDSVEGNCLYWLLFENQYIGT